MIVLQPSDWLTGLRSFARLVQLSSLKKTCKNMDLRKWRGNTLGSEQNRRKKRLDARDIQTDTLTVVVQPSIVNP